MSGEPTRRRVIPEDEVPCVWMTAGVVSFRLCDRDLMCADCPLDRALRNLPAPAGGEHPQTMGGCRLPTDRFYHPGHTWVRVRKAGELEVGVDDLSRRLLDRVLEVVLPNPGERLREGETAFSIRTDRARADVAAPFSGEVVSVNELLLDRPDLLVSSPLEEAWVFRAVPRDPAHALTGLLEGPAATTWAERETTRLRDLVEVATAGAVEVGPTMADGGLLDRGLLSEVAPEAARRILRLVFRTGGR